MARAIRVHEALHVSRGPSPLHKNSQMVQETVEDLIIEAKASSLGLIDAASRQATTGRFKFPRGAELDSPQKKAAWLRWKLSEALGKNRLSREDVMKSFVGAVRRKFRLDWHDRRDLLRGFRQEDAESLGPIIAKILGDTKEVKRLGNKDDTIKDRNVTYEVTLHPCNKEERVVRLQSSLKRRYSSTGMVLSDRLTEAVVSSNADLLTRQVRRTQVGGAILVDASGSMYGTLLEDLRDIVLKLPGFTVYAYDGQDGNAGLLIGNIWCIAQGDFLDSRISSFRDVLHYGGNTIDAYAMRYVIKHHPTDTRVFITDQQYCGAPTHVIHQAHALENHFKYVGTDMVQAMSAMGV